MDEGVDGNADSEQATDGESSSITGTSGLMDDFVEGGDEGIHEGGVDDTGVDVSVREEGKASGLAGRVSTIVESARVFTALVKRSVRTLVFSRTRKLTELVLRCITSPTLLRPLHLPQAHPSRLIISNLPHSFILLSDAA